MTEKSFAREYGPITTAEPELITRSVRAALWIGEQTIAGRTLTNGAIRAYVDEQNSDLNRDERAWVLDRAMYGDIP